MIRFSADFQGYEITIFDNNLYSTVLIQEPVSESEMDDETQVRYWIGRKESVEALHQKSIELRSEMEEVLVRFFEARLIPIDELLPQEFNLGDYEFLDEEDEQEFTV
jgi:hypothetical protein